MIRKLKNIAHLCLAIGANVIHLFPGRGLTIIGVTGTDGKTTTANLLYSILRLAGKRVAVITTIGAVIDDKSYDTGFHVTTPSPFSIQKYIKLAKQKGCTHIILEVTSHALDQNRVWGVPFEIGVLTNVTHEHLDYHKSYKNYVHTKLQLLKKAKVAVANSNGEWFAYIKKGVSKEKLITYSLHGAIPDDITLLNLPFELKTQLLGDFNLENILAATSVSMKLGIDPAIISKAISGFEPPRGRQEILFNKQFMVMVDFAHTPNSFENLLRELRKKTQGRIIHVFGSAGERDHLKRPEMGKVGAFYDDVIVLTAEDPRHEKVSDINRQIRNGINGFSPIQKGEKIRGKAIIEIDDRKEAIEFALSIANSHDTIVITGKGHEKSMNLGNGEVKWSDQKVVKEYLKHNT